MNEAERLTLFGTTEPNTPIQCVQLGALSLELEAGALRHIRYRGCEILRALQFVVRDANWGTYTPARSNETNNRHHQCWEYGYDAEIDGNLRYRIDIRASAKRIEATARVTATDDFTTNRTGFVLLHPLDNVAGRPVTVVHSDGREEQTRFPELISPGQPFFDIRALRQTPAPGVTVECVLAGDVFEMEDQRNWTDASFKTYNRPLALPFPYVIESGQSFSQSVTITIDDAQPAATTTAGDEAAIAIELTPSAGPAPPELGIAVYPGQVQAASYDLLRTLAPAHLYAPLDLRTDSALTELSQLADLSLSLDAPLWLAAIVPGVAALADELAPLAQAIATLKQQPAGLLVLPAAYLNSYQPSGPWPQGPTPDEAVAAARERFPGIAVGGGMLTYFTELNRCRPQVPIDFISHATCAIVHAADDISVMETLQSLPFVFRSARQLAPSVAYRIGTGSIAMWSNPYGAGTVANPDRRRIPMAGIDPRQRALFGAAWHLGYYAAAAREGVDALALGSAGEPFAIAASGELYPVFHVLRGLAGGRGRAALTISNPTPERIAAVGWRRPDGMAELWLANLTPALVNVRSGDLGERRTVCLDAANVTAAATDPAWMERLAPAAKDHLALPPYAVARVLGELNDKP